MNTSTLLIPIGLSFLLVRGQLELLRGAMSVLMLVSACTALLLAANASGTTVLHKDVDQLVQEAEGIVVGTVRGTESRFGPGQDIYTFVTVDQIELLKGRYHQSSLTLRLEGGQVGNEILDIEGSPHFAAGDKVILFVKGNGKHMVPFVGWTQGVLRIEPDETGVEEITDHEGNRVLGLKEGKLLKERKHSGDLKIVDGPNEKAHSDIGTPPAGHDDKGFGLGSAAVDEVPAGRGKAVRASDFITALKGKVDKVKRSTSETSGFSATELMSADDVPDHGGNNQAKGPPGKTGNSTKQVMPPDEGLAPFLPKRHPLKDASHSPSGQ
jgi:hypothetical protein